MIYFDGATLLTPQNEIRESALLIANGLIASFGPRAALDPPDEAQRVDAHGHYLVPGFIDLQCNGAFGTDFSWEPAALWAVAARLPQYGITDFLPTIISSPPERIAEAQQAIQHVPAAFIGARPLGLHLEGPFLNTE